MADFNRLAAQIVQRSTDPDRPKAKRVQGREGGLVGGRVRADKLTAEERSAIAKRAAEARWSQEG